MVGDVGGGIREGKCGTKSEVEEMLWPLELVL